MRTFDTNVVVRIVLGDDPHQAALAARAWADALRGGGVFLPLVVLVELSGSWNGRPGWAATASLPSCAA